MALEIERRFLVAGETWRQHVRWRRRLRQGYLLAAADGLTVRVRLQEGGGGDAAADAAWLTLKALAQPNDAISRREYEYAIPVADARELLQLCGERQLAKWRHGLTLPGGEWVLDVFEDANAPLVVAEVELDRVDAPLVIPAWCAAELSGRHELSNAALAARPLALWPHAERAALLDGLAPRGAGGID